MSIGEQPAFPKSESDDDHGLSKKEYASIMAMQGLLASGWTGEKKEIVTESIAYGEEIMRQLSEK